MIDQATPAARLAQSRERLRQAIHGTTPAANRSPLVAARWWVQLKAQPAASIIVDAVQAWWALHPLNATVRAISNTTLDAVRPVARRHPLPAVLSAFMLGALLAWSRPRRWALKPALFAGLLPQVLSSWMLHTQPQPPPLAL
jgi:hypothetical protein